MTPCPSKRSHINPAHPPRVCFETCARFSYAVHLTGREYIKPAIRVASCPNHVPKDAPPIRGVASLGCVTVEKHMN